jgi:hypothetical protein
MAVANFEIILGTLGLCTPVLIGGDLHLTHGILFNPGFHDAYILS